MADRLIKLLSKLFIDWGFSKNTSDFLVAIIIIVFIALLSYALNFLTKKIIHNVLKQIVKRTKNNWDDILFKHRVFHRFSHIAPAFIIYYSADLFLKHYKNWLNFTHSAIYIYITVVFMLAFSSFLNALNTIYIQSPSSSNKPIKGYLQVVNIFNYCIGIIIILSIILDKDPSYFLTGIGAIAAVLLIVFKDSLLGLVAGIQLSANDMVKIGDWISMPSKNADGVVSEISLHTVKIENFDNTITYIPSYSMVSESFINWRGMVVSKARRIRRSVFVDLKSISFINNLETDKVKEIKYVPEILDKIRLENENFNKTNKTEDIISITNLGLFRKYCVEYLNKHPNIKSDLIIMARELQPTAVGIPLELYCFCATTEWKSYEEIQAEIIEHIIAIMPEFGIKLYQNPIYLDNNN